MVRRSSYSPLTQTRTVTNVFVNQKFDPVIVNDDITLLLVQVPFELNQWAATISLPPADYVPAFGTRCTAIGWGLTKENGLDCKI